MKFIFFTVMTSIILIVVREVTDFENAIIVGLAVIMARIMANEK